jgi:DNA-binding response OmpR family regulator
MKNVKLLKQLSVIYVDDDKEAREKLEQILMYYFAEVHTASSAQEAMEIYKKSRCNLLLVDYDMPVINGAEFIRKIRNENPKIPAVIISSYNDKEKLFDAIRLELVDYLVKPYSLDELKNVFDLVLEWMEKKGMIEISLGKELSYNYFTKSFIKSDKEVPLSPSEFKILEVLLNNEDRLIYYEFLIEMLGSESSHRSLVSQMHKLKKKLGIDIIKNVKDLGYILSR